MMDAQGRKIDYIRISVTDRCNLRCIYCMPEEGIDMVEHEEILSFDEIWRLCRMLAELGIKKVKLTGGEPLVRKNLVELVRNIKGIEGIEKVTLTTNGVFLADVIDELVEAGIDGINISLDTLNREVFHEITRRDKFDQVYLGIQKALLYPQISLKINCVPLGIAEQNLVDIAKLAKEHRIHIRFIELMPIGYGKQYEFLSEMEIISILEAEYGKLIPYGNELGFGPAHYYSVSGFQGKIGFISAISHKFCGECNRIRLTAQGYLKTCLQYEKGRDLKTLLRTGCEDAIIKKAIMEAIHEKPIEHNFLTDFIDMEESHAMSQIGG